MSLTTEKMSEPKHLEGLSQEDVSVQFRTEEEEKRLVRRIDLQYAPI